MNNVACFNKNVAKEIGVNKALIFSLLLELSNSKEKLSYIKLTAVNICKTYPFMSDKSVSRWLNELVKDGYLTFTIQGNDDPFDHSKSYRLTEKALELLEA